MNNTDDAKDSNIVELKNNIAQLKAELDVVKSELSADKLAKKIDSSYLSINNTRLFLQILAAIQTIFLAGAVAFGFIGFTNIMNIKAEAEKVREISKGIDDLMKVTTDAETKIKKQVAVIDDQLKRVDSTFRDKEKFVNEKVEGIQRSTNDAIGQIQRKTETSLQETRRKLGERLTEAEKNIEDVNIHLKNISETFNKVAISNEKTLNPREQQLLFLLAKEIDPENPVFNYNVGMLAANFGRYDEAIAAFDKVILKANLPANIIENAKTKKSESIKLKTNPPVVKAKDPQGVAIGDYVIFQLHLNTVDTLWKNGYITLEQGQKIFDDAKMKHH